MWDYLALSPLQLVERLRALPDKIEFVGDAVSGFQNFLQEQLGPKAYFPFSGRQVFMASALGHMALEKLIKGDVSSALAIQPFYLRAPEAEIKMQEKQKALGEER